MSTLPEVSTANFEAEVVKANVPVLVDFWAPWCGPCRMVAPVVEAAAEEFKGKMKFVKLNTDQSPDLAGKFQIMGIPCLIFFSAGKEVDRVVGFLTKEALAQKINSILARK
ncbi:MAG: thioredoxin [Candidatus Margulisiibacteriota bacterium]